MASESSAVTTSAGLRRRLRAPYTISRHRFSRNVKRHRSRACSWTTVVLPMGVGLPCAAAMSR